MNCALLYCSPEPEGPPLHNRKLGDSRSRRPTVTCRCSKDKVPRKEATSQAHIHQEGTEPRSKQQGRQWRPAGRPVRSATPGGILHTHCQLVLTSPASPGNLQLSARHKLSPAAPPAAQECPHVPCRTATRRKAPTPPQLSPRSRENPPDPQTQRQCGPQTQGLGRAANRLKATTGER